MDRQRINQALQRINAAADRLAHRSAGDPDLPRRHAVLRQEAEGALAELNRVIARLEG